MVMKFFHSIAELESEWIASQSIQSKCEDWQEFLVPLIGRGLHQGVGYGLMRFMSAGTLADLLARPLDDPPRPLRLVEALVDAVDRMHSRHLMHLDLKPGNIFVRNLHLGCTVLLADFTLSRKAGTESEARLSGTRDYLPPRYRDGAQSGFYVDCYALGICARKIVRKYRESDHDVWPDELDVLEHFSARFTDEHHLPESTRALVDFLRERRPDALPRIAHGPFHDARRSMPTGQSREVGPRTDPVAGLEERQSSSPGEEPRKLMAEGKRALAEKRKERAEEVFLQAARLGHFEAAARAVCLTWRKERYDEEAAMLDSVLEHPPAECSGELLQQFNRANFYRLSRKGGALPALPADPDPGGELSRVLGALKCLYPAFTPLHWDPPATFKCRRYLDQLGEPLFPWRVQHNRTKLVFQLVPSEQGTRRLSAEYLGTSLVPQSIWSGLLGPCEFLRKKADLPAVGVTPAEVEAFAKAVGFSVPSEALLMRARAFEGEGPLGSSEASRELKAVGSGPIGYAGFEHLEGNVHQWSRDADGNCCRLFGSSFISPNPSPNVASGSQRGWTGFRPALSVAIDEKA
jgi:serine/threonine protein kinase